MSVEIPAALHLLAANRSNFLHWYYSVGRQLQALTSKRRGTAGAAMRQIAEEVFGDRKMVSTLYACRRFANVCSERELAVLQGLNWKQVHYLISVRSKRLRMQMIHRAKSEGLGARQVALAIQERLGKRTNGGRKPRRVLLSPKAACRESTRLCNDLARQLPDWLCDVRPLLDEDDPEHEGLIATTRESMRNAIRALQLGLRRLPNRPA